VNISVVPGILKGGQDKEYIRFSGEVPANDLSGKQVDDDTEIIPLAGSLYVRKIADPRKIRSVLSKHLVQVVRTLGVIRVRAFNERLARRHLREIHRSHQAVHSADADVDAMITIQNVSDLVSAEALIIIREYLKDNSL